MKKIKKFLIITILTFSSIFLVIITLWQFGYIDFSRGQIIITKNTQCNLIKNNEEILTLISDANLDRMKKVESLEYHIDDMVKGSTLNARNEITRSLTNYDKSFIKNCTEQIYYEASLQSQQSFDNIYKLNNNVDIDAKFNSLKQKFANTMLAREWLYPNSTIAPLYVDIDWNVLLNSYDINQQQEFKSELISFFEIFFRRYAEKNVLKLLFALVKKTNGIINTDGRINKNIVAVTSYRPEYDYQYMAFNDKSFDKQIQYDDGFWSSKNLTTSLVHEYGHALENFFDNYRSERSNFNNFSFKSELEIKNILKNDLNLENWTSKYLNVPKTMNQSSDMLYSSNTPITASTLMIDFLANEVGVKEKQQKYLLAWSIITSGYGRKGGKRELFAEAFSQWLGTPAKRRGLNWELLNEFFLNYLPKYL